MTADDVLAITVPLRLARRIQAQLRAYLDDLYEGERGCETDAARVLEELSALVDKSDARLALEHRTGEGR